MQVGASRYILWRPRLAITLGDSMKILNYALALDGGTEVITLENNKGEQINVGLDGRIESPLSGKQLFIGTSPDGPETKLLEIGGAEELEIISLLEKWLDQTQGFLRREVLMETDPASLKGQDILDRMSLEFLLKVKQRDVA